MAISLKNEDENYARCQRLRKLLVQHCCLVVDLETVDLYELMEGMNVDKMVSECLIGYQCNRKAVCDEICYIHIGFANIQEKINEELKGYTIRMLIQGIKQV